jgi:hypothetical protein
VDVVVIVLPLSRAAALSAAAISASGRTSASMTRSGDLVRSWLRSSRTVLEVRIDIVAAAADEARDQHALERADVHLRLDRRLDRDLVEPRTAHEADARGERGDQDDLTCRCGASYGH